VLFANCYQIFSSVPACLINVLLALLALVLYVIGSYRFYRQKPGYTAILGSAIIIDIATAILASFKITPTMVLPGLATIPWHSWLFRIHVVLSTIGFVGFIALFIYLLIRRPRNYSPWIRRWQFLVLLPIWVIGEGIALSNALTKIFLQLRLFELF
jgi:hypothetical protein